MARSSSMINTVVLALLLPTTSVCKIQPVLAIDFPDPTLVQVSEDSWLAFATSGRTSNIQVAASPSFLKPAWRLLTGEDPLPDPGPWAKNDHNVWAPDVIQLDDGRWLMYYAATSAEEPDKHCVGAALALHPLGPYFPAETPMACPLDKGGAIDPAAFLDPVSGRLYVVYKIDGNSLNKGTGPCRSNAQGEDFELHSTPIMLQQVSMLDGVTLIGDPVEVLDWEEADGMLVEAPNLFYNNESAMYFLTFSSNCYSTDFYDISFAYSSSLDCKFVKSAQPLMTSSSTEVSGPGGADTSPDGQFAPYHGTVGRTDKGEPIRHMFAAFNQQSGPAMVAEPL